MKKKAFISLREMIVLSMLGTLLFVTQVVMAALPNINLVSVFVIVYTLVYGRKVLYPIYLFAMLEGLVYGFGIWWIMYLYVWTILAVIVLLLKEMKSAFGWAVIAGLFGLCFGFLCSFPYFFIGGFTTMISWWISGIPYDITHCVSNFILTLILFKPLYSSLSWLERRSKVKSV